MDTELIVLLVGLPVAFALGWAASHLDLRQLRQENRSAPKAYFQGLNHLLNEQQDRAIDAFIEAVQKDPDTSELHFALGNLFRRRGEYERAVRVHEHLLAREDLSADDHHRAQHALAMDFLKAGLLDRAENALRKLKGTSYAAEAQSILLSIYERSHDWKQADATALTLESLGQGSHARLRAHYLCERAEADVKRNEMGKAATRLTQAISIDPTAARPQLQLAVLQQLQERYDVAFTTLAQTVQNLPGFAPLAAARLVELGIITRQIPVARQILEKLQEKHPSIDLVQALAALDAVVEIDADAAALMGDDADVDPKQSQAQRYLTHLREHPSLLAATHWLNLKKLADDPERETIDNALTHACKPLARYRCAACGFEANKHYWHCPGCQSWDSYPPRRIEEL